MKLQYLIATMNRDSFEFVDNMNINSDAIIINQYDKEFKKQYIKRKHKLEVISMLERGLSKSRNAALENMTGDIGVLSDDDIIYTNNADKIIIESYKKFPEADVIVFQIKSNNGKLYKKYKNKSSRLNRLTIMKVSSVEITFKKRKIIDKKIRFEERFGAGAEFKCGEENIFLNECIKNDLKVIYVPKVIAKLTEGESSWFKGYDKEYFMSKGAMFKKMYRYAYPLFIFQFAIRKKHIFSESINFKNTIKYMFLGSKKL